MLKITAATQPRYDDPLPMLLVCPCEGCFIATVTATPPYCCTAAGHPSSLPRVRDLASHGFEKMAAYVLTSLQSEAPLMTFRGTV